MAKSMTLPQKLAAGASFLGLMLVTAIPWIAHDGLVVFDGAVAINFLMTAAILFTAAFAADNLRTLTESTRAQFLPVLDVDVALTRSNAHDFITVSIVNLGLGHASGVRAVVWMQDDDGKVWLPSLLRDVSRHLGPGEKSFNESERGEFDFEFAKHFRPDWPQVVVEVRYRHALSSDEGKRFPFELARDDEGAWALLPSSTAVPSDFGSADRKLDTFREEARQLQKQHRLEELGLRIEVRPRRKSVAMCLLRGDQVIVETQRDLKNPAFDLVESFRNILHRALSVHDDREDLRAGKTDVT